MNNRKAEKRREKKRNKKRIYIWLILQLEPRSNVENEQRSVLKILCFYCLKVRDSGDLTLQGL